jgi:hypothetical protein
MHSLTRTLSHAGAGAAWLAACTVTVAQGALDADNLRQFAGSYATDCAAAGGAAAAPRLRVASDALTIEQGEQRMTGRSVRAAPAALGAQPPAGFKVALVSQVKDRQELQFHVYADKAGMYVMLEGDATVKAALGDALMKPKYRRCDPPSAAEAAAFAPPPPARPPVGAIKPGVVPDLATLTEDPSFKRAYLRALGQKVVERWLTSFDGPAPKPRLQAVLGTRYVVAAFCKAHDCADNNAVVVYAVEKQQLFGLLQQRGRKTLLGAPPADMAAELERIWAKEYPRN